MPESIKVRWTDAHGEAHEQVFEEFPAVVIQHEMDHLDGVILLDKASGFRRRRYLKKVKKARAELDDALRRCAMSSDRLVTVHWGANEGAEIAIELLPGHTAVDGRSLADWAAGTGPEILSAAQVDLAWQSVVTAIGRPDPLLS